ncbi:MAG: TatD family hydrolase [Suipraeoptans sp.]
MIFDTHAHYDDEQFDNDREELLLSMESNGVGGIVNIAASYTSCISSAKLANSYPFIYAAVGTHPDEIGELNDDNYREVLKLYDDKRVVAVGEIGLDYYWETHPHELQKQWFIRQIEEAKIRNLPIVVHSRDAAADTLDIIKEYGQETDGVMHAFSYSVELAREYVKMGYYLGIGGVVTFKNGKKLKEVVADIPIEHLVLETDCPYLSPEPFRGKRNSSINLKYVVDEIANIKNISREDVIRITNENAKRLYKLTI